MKSKKLIYLFIGILFFSCTQQGQKSTQKNPVNILWLFGEDISPWMPAYGDNTVKTPNIDFLAENGVLFTNCYSVSGVCSPTRSGIITGSMPTTIGAHNHRTGRTENVEANLPSHVQVLPQIFKKQGYHTYNEGKDDFNWKYDWNDYWTGPHKTNKFYGKEGHGSWEDRKEGQAFFGVIELFGGKNKNKPDVLVDPKTIKIPPYYPDIPSVRKSIANHYNQITMTDIEIGKILEKLKSSDIYDNTIIIFMSDNGYKTMRDKQFLYDGGIHMPLIISAPGNPKLLKQKGVRDDLVSIIDVAATTLALAGIEIPKYMESKDIFAKNFKRDYVIAAKDRCDFTIDRIRAVRSKEFKYIRNYMTDRPLMQPQYRDKRKDYKELIAAYKDPNIKFYKTWLDDFRPAEELYDLKNDPHEINNLANDKAYAKQLKTMRDYLDNWVKETDDKGQYPESEAQLKALYERWGERCVNPEYDAIK